MTILRARLDVTIAVVLALTLPWLVSGYWLFLFTTGLVFSLTSLSLIVLQRSARAVSLCQPTFMGIAAYVTAWLSNVGWPLLLAAIVGIAITVPLGMLLALPAMSLSAVELAAMTMSVALAGTALLFGGQAPIDIGPQGARLATTTVGPFDLADTTTGYFATLVVAAVAFSVIGVLFRSPIADTWRAIGTGNAVAASAGISVVRHKTSGFAIATALAATSGVVLVVTQSAVDESSFGFAVGIGFVVVGMLTGLTEARSALFAGLALAFGPAIPREFDLGSGWWSLVLGVVVVAALLRNTDGRLEASRG